MVSGCKIILVLPECMRAVNPPHTPEQLNFSQSIFTWDEVSIKQVFFSAGSIPQRLQCDVNWTSVWPDQTTVQRNHMRPWHFWPLTCRVSVAIFHQAAPEYMLTSNCTSVQNHWRTHSKGRAVKYQIQRSSWIHIINNANEARDWTGALEKI